MRLGRWIAVTALFALPPVQGLGAQQYFGQNQVHYQTFDWRVIETEHFRLHYYPVERTAAYDAARMAERSYARLSLVLGHQFREKKPILLFASRTDFAQNTVEGDLGEGVGGVTEAGRQRNLLPLTGDYGSFQRVLTHEMVHQFQYDVFAGGKAGANLQTLEQLNPPGWFTEGMAEYLSVGPDHVLTSTWIRDDVANGELPTIKQMTDRPDRYFPYRYGEALWQYVGERWGDVAIGAILQSTTTVGVERAFQRELGISLTELSQQWNEAMRAKYLPRLASYQRAREFAQPLLTPQRTKGQLFIAPALSPDGRYIAFLSNGSFRRGEVFIDLWLGDARTGKRIKRLIKSTTNANFEELRLLYSQGGFSNDGRKFAFTAQRGGKDVLSVLDLASGDVKQYTDLAVESVLSPSYSPDSRQIAFSGTVGGITNLYIVDADGRNLRQLTNDQYGDLQPQWSPDGRSIAFATDRATLKLKNLDIGKWQIGVLDIASGAIQVLPQQTGMNINPQWSPDSRSIAFVSDRTGIPNIFLFDLQSQQQFQITNVLSGINSFTEFSPVISWSRGSDRLAFTYFSNGTYSVWTLDRPRSLQRAPYQAVAAAPRGAAALPGAAAARADSAAPPSAGATSTYRADAGARQSEQLSVAEAQADTSGTSIAALLANPNMGLPDTSRFREYAYRLRFQPDYISGAQIGVQAGGGYGTMYGGGTTLVFGDLVGEHKLAVGGGVNGRISDASLFTAFLDQSRRWQYMVGGSVQPYYFYAGSPLPQQNGDIVTYQNQFQRFSFRNLFSTVSYPFTRFSRFETGLQLNSIGRSVVSFTTDCSFYYQACGAQRFEKLGSASTINYASPSVALVNDNALFGITGPISGQRARASVSPAVGTWRWMQYTADYRRYVPIVFNTLTFATRILGDVTVGRDENRLLKYVGSPQFVRGYDRSGIFGNYRCSSFLGSAVGGPGNTCSTAQLQGSRVMVANAELRFPVIRRFDLGRLPIGLPPVDAAIFYDAGLAWSSGQTVTFSKPANYDLNRQRYVLRSYGAGLRVNVFNLVILRWDYAKPLDNFPSKWNWTFSIGPSF